MTPVTTAFLWQIAPHLLPLRPHLPLVIPYLPVLAKHTDRFAPYVAASANADVLVFYFGWVLKVHVAAVERLSTVAPVTPRAVALRPHATRNALHHRAISCVARA